MTLDEKLDIFYKSAIENATTQSEDIIASHISELEKRFAQYEKDARRSASEKLRTEGERLAREKNRQISKTSVLHRRAVTEHSSEICDKIFEKLEKKIADYMQTSEYKELLIDRINMVLGFAGDSEVVVYLNSSDSEKKEELENECSTQLKVSETDFIGGIKAVVQERNVLIDYSFATRIQEARENFSLI